MSLGEHQNTGRVQLYAQNQKNLGSEVIPLAIPARHTFTSHLKVKLVLQVIRQSHAILLKSRLLHSPLLLTFLTSTSIDFNRGNQTLPKLTLITHFHSNIQDACQVDCRQRPARKLFLRSDYTQVATGIDCDVIRCPSFIASSFTHPFLMTKLIPLQLLLKIVETAGLSVDCQAISNAWRKLSLSLRIFSST